MSAVGLVARKKGAAMPAELTAAETFEAWATGAAAIVTATAIFIGGLWALWRYVLPRPFQQNWSVEIPPCRVRRLPSGAYIYTAELSLTNNASAPYFADRVLAGLFVGQPIGEVATDKLGDAGQDKVFLPRAPMVVNLSHAEEEALCEVVVVAWRLEGRSRRWFGIFGWRDRFLRGREYVPVDGESLAMHRKQGK